MVRDAGERERRRRNEERGSRQLEGREGGGWGEVRRDIQMSIPSLCQDIQTILNKVSCLDHLSPKILDNLRLFGAVEHAAYSGGWACWVEEERRRIGRKREKGLLGRKEWRLLGGEREMAS